MADGEYTEQPISCCNLTNTQFHAVIDSLIEKLGYRIVRRREQNNSYPRVEIVLVDQIGMAGARGSYDDID